MAVSRDQKKVLLQELKDKLKSAQSVVFTNYIGLKVSEVSELRRKLKAAGAEMKVAKKTLMRIAAKEEGFPVPEEKDMTGPVACIFSITDPIVGPQVAFAFSKEHKQVQFLGGFFEGKLLTKSDAMTLATIPGKQVLLATFAGMLQSPLRSFASIINSPLTGFARALSEKAKKQPAVAAAPAA
ncbi:MAG: 50S ribosomal protein L10 [Candidatus Peribacteraceae bacterium]|nr:50S ribosomal protein L10 [Candidatus Peribacteraceae bacterium]